METKSAKPTRLASIDAIRGLAVLLVMLEHIPVFWPAGQNFLDNQLDIGRSGIIAFFLISGFVISMSLERQDSLTTFWIHRAFRILPMYWISVGLCTALLLGFPAVGHQSPYYTALPKSFFFNLTMLEEFFRQPKAMGLYGTLTFELVFYLVASFLTWIKKTQVTDYVLCAFTTAYLLIGLGVVHLHNSHILHFSLQVGAFLVGSCFYRYWSGKYNLRVFLTLAFSFWASVFFCWYRDATVFNPSAENQSSTVALLLATLLGYATFFGAWALKNRPFPNPLLWLGKVSYSVYLLQTLFLIIGAGLGLRPLEGAALLLIGTPLLSWLTFNKVEQPSIGYSRRLRPGKKPTPSPEPIIATTT